jgi:hypothetical protein
MLNRAARFALAILANVLASTAVATVSHSAATASDSCLSAPMDQSPEGRHWHYRIDRATKRHCWYLGELRETTARAVPANWDAAGQRSSADVDSLNRGHTCRDLPAAVQTKAVRRRTTRFGQGSLSSRTYEVDIRFALVGSNQPC